LQRIKQERASAQRTWADTVLAVDDTTHATTIDTRDQAIPTAAPVAAQTEAPVDPWTASGKAAVSRPVADTSAQPEDSNVTLMPDHQAEELFAELGRIPALAPTPVATVHSVPSIAEVLTAQALFDVQEQAEFYASIGENDQAIEILQTHIDENEASSPLAYIELLQLLYRLSRTETFEQVREKFQTHFNVQVPNFLGFSRKGRDLWSGHPEVLGKIEALWPTDEVQPLLRSLIVRKPSTEYSESDVRFDLAAFDDLLMLYNVAQTTPAASRGQLPGRMRTAPTEAPLPEVFFDDAKPTLSNYGLLEEPLPLSAPPLPLHEAHLDALTAAPAQAPLAPPNPVNDSPFQGPSHFAPDEALMDGLSLDWGASAASVTSQNANSISPQAAPLSLDAELEAFMMDERDLPPASGLKKHP